MTDKPTIDERLHALFRQGLDSPRDDGFSVRVVARIRHRRLIRRAVLSVAAAAGAVMAMGPAYGLASAYGGALAGALTGWATADGGTQHHLVGAGVLVALFSPVLVRLIED